MVEVHGMEAGGNGRGENVVRDGKESTGECMRIKEDGGGEEKKLDVGEN